MLTLGLDIGTTGTKGIAFDEEGHAVASAYRPYPLFAPQPGWLELEPGQVLEAVGEVISGVAQEACAKGYGRIHAIASAALGEAVVPVDAQGQCLDRSITALDLRSRRQVERFASECMGPEALFRITGQVLHPILTLGKILWWKTEKPEVFAHARRFLCWNEMLAAWLGLEPALAPSLAGRTGLYDVRQGDWSDEILGLAGLSREYLGRIVPAGRIVGEIPGQMCSKLGLDPRCVLVSGGWDQSCAALGGGAIEPGVVVNSMGSSDSLNATFDSANTSEAMQRSSLTCNPQSADGLYCTNAFSTCGGNLLQWWKGQLASPEELEASRSGRNVYDVIVESAMQAENPALVPAYFAGAATPHMDASARGGFLGLTLATTRADMARGLLEGIAFEMALNLENLRKAGLPVTRVFAGGGAAKNQQLLQLRANAYRMPVTVLQNEEIGVAACGMLARGALDGAGALKSIVQQWVHHGKTVDPQPDAVSAYQERYSIYVELYEALRPIARRLAQTGGS